jgi:hypothetical protein
VGQLPVPAFRLSLSNRNSNKEHRNSGTAGTRTLQESLSTSERSFLYSFSRKNLLHFLNALLQTSLPAIAAGKKSLLFERFPRGRVGSSRPVLRRKIVME